MGRTIEDIEVTDVEKRKVPSKHYVYILHVQWSDQSTNVIYRRYSRFFDFQSQIIDMFPEEAGALDPSKRIIPFLPGKKFFGRSHIREVAIKRMTPIAEYCKSIVRLPRKISQCKDVIQFFELEPDDINPPTGRKASVKAKKISQPKPLEVYVAVTEYKKQEKGEVTLAAGMLVEVVEKTETGWWFVNVEDEQGWVPSTCLEREDGLKEDSTVKFSPGEEEQYLCTEEFRGEGEDELSMERGAVVEVIEKNLEGWWLVRYNGQEGYVPATFLLKTESVKVFKKNKDNKMKNEKVRNDKTKSEVVNTDRMTTGPEIVKSLMDISDLLKDEKETPPAPVTRPTASQLESDDDVFDDDDDDYELPQEEEKIYSVQELSKILREDKRGCAETDKVYESIQNMKSRSLKRYGSTRPPPRPSAKPSEGGFTPTTPKPPLVHSESFCTEYVTIAAFSDAVGDGISFQEGQTVKVLEKSENGWWYIEIDHKEGWAPAAYIKKVEPVVNSVLPVVNKARVPSPLVANKKSSTSRSREDLTNGDSDDSGRRTSTVGDLASAIKNKLSKGNKQPPTPPKKDFLTENETREEKSKSGQFEPGKLQIPGGFSLPGQQMGLKKVLDRSNQPPPPAPPANRSMQPPPPAPPIKVKENLKPQPPAPPIKGKVDLKPPTSPIRTSEDPKPCPFGTALKPTPPKKNDTKTDSKPKPPSLPMKPHNEKPKPSVPFKHNDNKPKVPVKKTDTANENENSVSGMASALKAKFDNDEKTPPKPNMKPKPPVKSKVGDSERTSNVAGLADVLKARFEASSSEKPETQTQKPNVNPKVTPPPPPVKKPGLGNPSVPSKSRNSSQAPQMPTKSAWVKNTDSKSPPMANKPSWAKNNSDMPKSRVSELNDDSGAHKVSDLANVLKAKFEHRTTVGDTPPGSEAPHREGKPIPPGKAAIKPFQKPARPSTPPSPRSNLRKNQGRQKLPSPPIARSSSSGSIDKEGLDPKKYSSRPLPPQPKHKTDTTNKPAGKATPALPVKPKSSSPAPHFGRADSSDSSDSDGDSKPVGVSNLANALKAKLGNKSAMIQEDSYLTPADEAVINNLKNDSDIENNNIGSESSSSANLFTAIADFAGQNDGEIRLVQGQHVELLETAEGWSYVSIGGNEGWAPSTYIEKVGQGGEPGSWTCSQSVTTTQTVFRTNSEFIAENDGEISVSEGQEVNVLENQDPDWWFIETSGNEGWVPASYIEEVTV